MEEQAVSYLQHLAQTIPLPVFAFFTSILEEIIAVIPSPFVPITVGTLTYEQGLGISFILFVALVASTGKTLATLLTYWIANKFGEFITTSKLGKIIGVDKEEVEKYGKYLDGSRKDTYILLLLRALPFIPTLPVSLLAGLIKVNLFTYVWTTFVGIYFRFLFFSILAYEGVRKYSGLLEIVDTTDSLIKVSIILTFVGWLFLFLRKKWDKIINFILRKKTTN